MDFLTPIANIIMAFTGMCTFMLTLFIAVQARKIHTKTDELVVHTNSLTDRLMEKTDTVARAEGVKEGILQQSSPDPAVLAASIIEVASDKLAATLAAAISSAKP